MEDLDDFFLNCKPAKIMVKLGDKSTDNYASSLSSEVDATYAHTVRIIAKMEEFDLIETEKKGRKKIIKLTDEGEDVSEDLTSLFNKFRSIS